MSDVVIPDLWPDCACKGLSPQMLEHSKIACAVMPTLLLDAIDADRPLTADELAAIETAIETAKSRGYRGPKLDAQTIVDAMGTFTAGLGL